MKKKLISIVAAAAILTAFGTAAMADDKTPEVYVDSAKIIFKDQAPVIMGEGYTLVPARGVFEAMGAEVKWDGENRLVEIESADHKTVITLTIDSNEMKVRDMSNLLGSILTTGSFDAPEALVTLDAPAIIMEETGRTMIPLRAISEALKADVQWDGENYVVNITTPDVPTSFEGIPTYKLSASADKVNEGETVDVFVELSNLPANKFVSGVTAVVSYDQENFEFENANLVNGDAVVENSVNAVNTEIEDGNRLKAVFVTIDDKAAAKADGKVLKMTFRSKNGGSSEFKLEKTYSTDIGYNTTLSVDEVDEQGKSISSTLYEGADLIIDTTPVTVNGSAE